MRNSPTTRRQTWITTYRVATTVLLVALVAISGILLARPEPKAPTAAEIAQAVNGPVKFQRPGSMEYVAKTNSCIVGGTVTSSEWHLVGGKTAPVGSVEDLKTVNYTKFGFKADNGQVFTVSDNAPLFTEPGEDLGLELDCDPATMKTAASFGMIAIIYGGK